MTKSCRIILVDDHAMFRMGLKSLINQEPNLRIVAEAADGEELLSKLRTARCDLVILDLSMPNMGGIEAMKLIRQKFSKIIIIVLTMQKDHEHFKHAVANGASGYILKEEAYDQLTLAIKQVMKGKQFFSPSVSTLVTDRYIRSLDEIETPALEILTKREQQILTLIANGLPNKNIATKLKLSVRTVETHRLHITEKLGIKNTANLVKYAVSKGLV